jgi:hypothetical protein
MDKAMTTNGRILHANHANKGVPYLCACCGSDVILAAGEKNRKHFRHKDAINQHEVLFCENYVKQLGNDIDEALNLYEEELQLRSQVRLELACISEVWKLHLRLPIIKPEFHAIIDRERLYFLIRCEEERHEVSSVHLHGLTGASYKIPIRIRDSYSITVNNPALEKMLKIQISGTHRPFQGNPLLFKFIQGCLLHIPHSRVILSGRFMILSPYKLTFPSELTRLHEQELEGYILYDCQMPNEISSNLLDWFARVLRINVLQAVSHLDLLAPVTFRLSQGMTEVSTDSVTLQITHSGVKPVINWIAIVEPDGQRQVISQRECTMTVRLTHQGPYSIYFLNQRGERFEVQHVPEIVHKSENPLWVTINDKQALFDSMVSASRQFLLSANCSLTVYLADGTSDTLNRPSGRYFDQITRLYIPFVWSVNFQTEMSSASDTILPLLLQQLEQRARYLEVYLGMRRFQQLSQYISHSAFTDKNRLLLLLNMRRGFVPFNSLSLIHQMEESL